LVLVRMLWLRDGAECAPGCSGTGWPSRGSLHVGKRMKSLSFGLLPGALMAVLSDQLQGWVQSLELGNAIQHHLGEAFFLEKQSRKKARIFHLFSKPSCSMEYILLSLC